MTKEKFCGIPVSVSILKSLTESEKYLFGVISYNSTEQGYWFIQSEFLTDLFKVSESNLSTWIFNLQKEGIITSMNKKKNGCIFLSIKILFPYLGLKH